MNSISQKLERLGSLTYLSSSRLLKSNWIVTIVILISAFIFFFRLGQSSLADWDEAIYAEIAKQMVTSGEYLSQRYGNELFFEKPPLSPWSIAAFFNLFSIDEFWARSASAISGVLLSMVVYFIGRTVYTPQVGFIAVMTMLSIYEVEKRGRYATTDMMLVFFIYLALLAYLKLDRTKQKWWYVVWISFAFAFMVKFWAALILPATIAAAIVIDRKMDVVMGSKHFWRGAFLAGLIIIPWHLIMLIRHGQSFIDIYVLRDLVARSTTSLEGHTGDKFHYFRLMQRTFVPWIYILPISIAIELNDNLLDRSRSRVLLILITVTITLYSLVVATKLLWYILPVYPALALFIASTIEKAYRDCRTVALSGLIFTTFIGLLIAPNKLIFIYLPVILLVAYLALRYFGKILPHQVAVVSMYGFLITLSVLANVRGYNVQPLFTTRQMPIADLARTVSQLDPETEAPIIGVALRKDSGTVYEVRGPSATFYSNRTITEIREFEELEKLVSEGELREILVAKKYLITLSKNYEIDIITDIDPLIYGVIKSR